MLSCRSRLSYHEAARIQQFSRNLERFESYKDRLTRFGFNYFDILLPKIGCELVVINKDEEDKPDLMKDLVAIITSFCCRLYGLRRGKGKAKEVTTTALQEVKDESLKSESSS